MHSLIYEYSKYPEWTKGRKSQPFVISQKPNVKLKWRVIWHMNRNWKTFINYFILCVSHIVLFVCVCEYINWSLCLFIRNVFFEIWRCPVLVDVLFFYLCFVLLVCALCCSILACVWVLPLLSVYFNCLILLDLLIVKTGAMDYGGYFTFAKIMLLH